jgi:Holliday junction resolvase RusA-like endonuclease
VTRELELPYPPSVNHYYRHVGPRVLISREGRRYRELVVAKLKAEKTEMFAGAVELHIELYPPDNRRRDIDNSLKIMLDAFTHGGLYEDDSLIRKLTVIKQEPMPPGGMAYIRIQSWNIDRTAVAADASSSSSC